MSLPLDAKRGMTSEELNPNNPVLVALRDNWHVVAAVILHKLGKEIEITNADIEAFRARGGIAVVADARGKGLVLRLTSRAEAERLARGEGGLPV